MDDLIAAERLSMLIGCIYDCAIDPSCWAATINAIRVELGFQSASLDLVLLPEGTSLLNIMANIPEPYAARMLDYAPQLTELWGGDDVLMTLPLNEPAVLSRVVPNQSRLQQHPMYSEWAAPQGMNDILALWLARDAGVTGVVAFGWAAAAGHIGERELTIARMLLPHLQRAVSINRLLDLASLQRATFSSLFDTLSVPIFLTDGDLTILHANDAGRAVLAEGDPVRAHKGRLTAVEPAITRALAVGVQAAADAVTIDRKGMGIPIRRRDGDIGALYVLPLRTAGSGSLLRSPMTGAAAAVFLARTATSNVVPANLIATLFGLTSAEAKVLYQILSGATAAEAAKRLQVRESTVKTHLLRVYDKTGVRRQTDLVRMAAALTVPAMIDRADFGPVPNNSIYAQ